MRALWLTEQSSKRKDKEAKNKKAKNKEAQGNEEGKKKQKGKKGAKGSTNKKTKKSKASKKGKEDDEDKETAREKRLALIKRTIAAWGQKLLSGRSRKPSPNTLQCRCNNNTNADTFLLITCFMRVIK
ncbi:hypothetical protein PHYPSEUDO_013855 [Phytophthora pseudosyringae]|uniref:Uncharacterized protein n=1 Tax=Phytophthora pseudosyringae TaxID=221518 RepID=A0A8T1V861_9STRA|nr:hypothetical protein PHYPSEUDO_013855 [Phytophthora pseudosyringae]